ncbi:MAG: hypothetical protein LBH68_06720 [Bifidobacteriaceae bacterium]|nr:hypothetical protein [Bifidobacteriaceae bacterium]
MKVLRGIGLAAATLVAANWLFYRSSWQRNWGATPAERDEPLPGDHHIPKPKLLATRAITIAAPPEEVWPWLVQLGMGRGGWYALDGLLNRLGSVGMASATGVMDNLQGLKVGDDVALWDAMTFGVTELKKNEVLVLYGDENRMPLQPWLKSWSFVLRPLPGGSTRLIVRESSDWTTPFVAFSTAAVGVPWFLLTYRQLKNLKALVEAG